MIAHEAVFHSIKVNRYIPPEKHIGIAKIKQLKQIPKLMYDLYFLRCGYLEKTILISVVSSKFSGICSVD